MPQMAPLNWMMISAFSLFLLSLTLSKFHFSTPACPPSTAPFLPTPFPLKW